MKTYAKWTVAGAIGLTLGSGHAATGVSEQDYFEALPVVLTVSRLEQPISDTPGAVTVIDRETIRRSGARDVTDLLRLVPGYLVSGWNGANPNAMYHAPLDDFGTRNLVLIDGRSVYSPFYLGDTHHGMMTVLLEDIERIEVLRGSNSAAYGANAMFGVINIITRHSADTLGGLVSMNTGNGGVGDLQARVGWGSPESASYRLSVGQRSDTGFVNMFDDRRLSQVHLRGDWRIGAGQEMQLATGSTVLNAEEGRGKMDNPDRRTEWRDWYLRGQWKRQISDTEEIKFSFDFDEEKTSDVAPYGNTDILLDFGGRGRRYNAELQHQLSLTDQVRMVWGVGYKQDEARSDALYGTGATVKVWESRLFGNLEWRLTPQWLLNAGLFLGDHSRTGIYSAPRLMLNYQLAPDHTLRLGGGRSVRTPTLFELAGDVRYYSGGQFVANTVLARGGVQPESLSSTEIGYFGNFREQRLTVDVRAYFEKLKDMTWLYAYPYPYPVTIWYGDWMDVGGTSVPSVSDYTNLPGFTTRGLEMQCRWSIVEGTDLWFNQNWQDYDWQGSKVSSRVPPAHATTVALFQQLPADWNLSLVWHAMGKTPWKGVNKAWFPATQRIDLRLAKQFQLDAVRAETALTVQSLNGAQPELLTETSAGRRWSDRRAYLTLRLEY